MFRTFLVKFDDDGSKWHEETINMNYVQRITYGSRTVIDMDGFALIVHGNPTPKLMMEMIEGK